MEPLATFTDMEVLGDTPPSNWQMVTLSRPTEPEQPDQGNQQERSCNRNWRAHTTGTFMVACGMGHSKPTVTAQAAGPSLAPTQWEECHSWQLSSPSGFMEISRSLCGDDPPCKVTRIPWGPAEEQSPIQIAESTMFSAQFLQDSLSGATYIDMMTCSMSLVVLRVTSLVDHHPMPTLLGEEEMDSD